MKKSLENQKRNPINVVFAAKRIIVICLEYVGETLFYISEKVSAIIENFLTFFR